MKQTLRRELTNIIFLVLIVAAAVVIYLLSRAESATQTPDTSPTPASETASKQTSEETESADASAPTNDPEESSTTRGVPESVFKTHLLSSELYAAAPVRNKPTTYTLIWNESEQAEVLLTFELRNGDLSSLEITFQLPEVFQGKPKSDIEKRLAEASESLASANNEVIPALLLDLLPASDAKDKLQQTSIRFWTEEAQRLKKVGDKFEDTLDGYHFIAYRKQGDVLQELVCILYLT